MCDLLGHVRRELVITIVLRPSGVDGTQHASAHEGSMHGEGLVGDVDEITVYDLHATDDLCDLTSFLQLSFVERLTGFDLTVQPSRTFLLTRFVQCIYYHLGDCCDLLVAHERAGYLPLESRLDLLEPCFGSRCLRFTGLDRLFGLGCFLGGIQIYLLFCQLLLQSGVLFPSLLLGGDELFFL